MTRADKEQNTVAGIASSLWALNRIQVHLLWLAGEHTAKAIENASGRASQSLKGWDWFEFKEVRANVQDGKVAGYQVKLAIGFRLLEAADLGQD